MSADDPYAGADLPSSRNATAVLTALNGLLILALLPLFPPDQGLGAVPGWLLALGGVVVDLAAAAWLLTAREIRFGPMLAIAYAGVAQLLLMQFLAQTVLPYQLLILVWVGASAVQPPRRAVVLLAVILAATVAPVVTGVSAADGRNVVGRALLFATIGLVLIAYVAYVRAQRVRLRAQEQDARAEASAATKRVRDLQWITDAALANPGLQDLMNQLLDRVVQVFGVDQGAILLRSEQGSRFELRASHGVSPGRAADRRTAEGLAARVAASRRPVAVRRGDAGDRLDTLLASARVESVLGAPLVADRQLLGALLISTFTPRRFSEDDSALLQLVADRVALAVDRARLFERERHIAETLQRSLLPERLPHIAGTDVAVRYLPAGAGTEVGGDWYDMLELGDGQIVLAMGDVVGKGVRAAALMGKLRNSLEAYAFDQRSPEEVMERLHSLMERHHRTEMATLVYVAIDAQRETAEVACAGHLPPLLRDANGEARFLGAHTSPPLGGLPYARFEAAREELGAACTLLLFTDGLVEVRGTSIELRLEELRRTVEAGPGEPEELCDAVLRQMLGDSERQDDVAMLAFEICPLPAPGFALHLPAEPEALSSVRKALDRWLIEAGTSRKDAYAITVACGEACANAVEHAYRPGDAAFRVEASRMADDVVVAVHDSGRWRDPRGVDRGRGLPLMEALMDEVDVRPSPTGTTVRLRRRLAAE